MSAAAFAERFPHLFHVTRRSALPGIEADGLRAAAALAGDRAVPGNRQAWTPVGTDAARPVWLRWQRMRDPVLARRLPPSIAPAAWRAFIDGFVFFSVRLAEAEAFAAWPADRGIDQCVLAFDTAAVIEAGHALRFCRWNNGFPDRCRPPRRRGFEDYRPLASWRRGEAVREIVAAGPVRTAFAVIAPTGARATGRPARPRAAPGTRPGAPPSRG